MMINCTIIDDDKVFTNVLEHYISKVDFLEHKQTFHNSTQAYNEVDFNNTDLIFLDMEIPSMHGLDFLKALSVRPNIVFISKSKTYGPEAFEYGALDYLHKPIPLSRFLQCADRVKKCFTMKENFSHEHDSIFIKYEGIWQKLALNNIYTIKADNNHIIISTGDKKYRTNITIKNAIEKLSESGFMQVHRSYVVQLNKITKVDGEIIEINNKTIPVSKTYIKELYHRLNLK